MSTDVYFDFHTPELYEVYKEESWSKWYSKLVQLELQNKESYFVSRVSHLSNLIIPTNLLPWDSLRENLNGKLIDRSLIANVITSWASLYKEVQKSEHKSECVPEDMLTAGQIKIILKKYKGNHLVFRTD